MSDNKYLLLGVGKYRLPAITSIQKWGGYAICIDGNPKSEAFALADEGHVLSVTDEAGILEIAKGEGVCGIIPMADCSVEIAAHISELLGLRSGITYENALCASRKNLMRARMKEYGVPIPLFDVCNDFDGFVNAIKKYDFDCVIKPADNSFSRGVKALDKSYVTADLRELYDATAAYSNIGVVMVEERVYGPEFSAESITIDGETTVVAITDKLLTEPPFVTEIGHSQPSYLSEDIQEKIKNAVKATVKAIGVENGPSHTEIKVTDRGPIVIEMGARMAGCHVASHLVLMSTGVDYIDVAMQVAMGMKPDIIKTHSRGAAIRFKTVDVNGVVDEVIVDDAIYDVDGLEELKIYAKPGDWMEVPSSNEWRIGHVLCSGPDGAAAVASADKALGFIQATIRG